MTDDGAPVEHTTLNIPVRVHVQQSAGDKEMKKNELSIYPNPSNGNFTITSEMPLQEVQVVAIDGSIVATSTPNASQMNIESLSPGTYLVKSITQEGKSSVVRIQVLP